VYEDRVISGPTAGKGEKLFDVRYGGRIVAGMNIDDVVHSQPEVAVFPKAFRRLDHVFGRQQRNEMRRPVAADDVGNGGQRGDEDARHGSLLAREHDRRKAMSPAA
jgi:hypothetical protein